jgi:hypothetical protein
MSRAAAFMLALLCAGGAAAQTPVYRCGADGRSYSHQPCDGGRAIEVDDRRSAQQAAQARQAVQRDVREANELERARLQAEREAARRGPVLIGWSKQSAVDKTPCAEGTKSCKGGNLSKRRQDKTHSVTLYRGGESATR